MKKLKRSSSTPARSLRDKRRDAVRASLLEAAETVFAAKGFDRATMHDIAAAAGCAAGMLYLYFKTKDDLFQGLVARHVRAIVTLMRAAMDAATGPVAKLRCSNQASIEYFNRYPDFFRIFYTASTSQNALIHECLQGDALLLYQGYKAYEFELIEQGQARGQIRSDIPASELVEYTHALFSATLARWATVSNPPPPDEQQRLTWLAQAALLGAKDKK